MKILKYFTLAIISLLLLMVGTAMLFSERVSDAVEKMIDDSIKGKFQFSNVKLTFFSQFPHLTLKVEDVALYDVPGFEQDTLFSGDEIAFGVNLFSIIKGDVKINRVFAHRLNINLLMAADGSSNMDVFESEPKGGEEESTRQSKKGSSVDIKNLELKDASFTLYDQGADMLIKIEGLNYRGAGGIKEERLSLKSRIRAQELLFAYKGVNYIDKKSVNARLITEADSDMTSFNLIRNDVRLEKLRASFHGTLAFMEEGYSIELEMNTKKTNLEHLLSLLPNEYMEWFSQTTFKGDAVTRVVFKGESQQGKGFNPNLDVEFSLNNGYIRHNPYPTAVENIELVGTLSIPSLSLERLLFNAENLSFRVMDAVTNLQLRVENLTTPHIIVKGEGHSNLEELTNALGLTSYQAGGVVDYSVDIDGVLDWEGGIFPVTTLSLELKEGWLLTPFTQQKLEGLNSSILISNVEGTLEDLSLEIRPLEFTFTDSPFYVEASLKNFHNLEYLINAQGAVNLDSLSTLFGVEEASVKGLFSANLFLKGEDIIEGRGELELENFEYSSADYAYPFCIPSSTFSFEEDRAILTNTILEYGSNRIELNGFASNFINYFFAGGIMSGALEVKSEHINLKDFTALIPEKSQSIVEEQVEQEESLKSYGVIQIPDRLNLALKTNISKIDYESVRANNFKGDLSISGSTFWINGTGVNIAGAKFLLDAIYKPYNLDSARVDLWARADSFDIARAYQEIPLIRELFSTAANMEGLISIDYKIATKLDSTMMPVYHTVKGGGEIRLEDVNVRGLNVLGAVSKATGRDSLANPNLKAVVINSTIANNIITIERTRMRIFGFRPRFEGQASLDGRLNINFRLGLPPLGIIGIPLTITGTLDNPVVEVRRGRDGDILYDREERAVEEVEIKEANGKVENEEVKELEGEGLESEKMEIKEEIVEKEKIILESL